jgi:hypothetical protein
LQSGGAGLDRQPSGDFRHGGQQGQAAAVVGDGLIGNRRHARLDQTLGLVRIGSEVQIGVEKLAFAQLHPFARLRLLDLDHHVGLGEHLLGGLGDARAGCLVGVVVGADSGARAALHQHVMAVGDVFAYRARGQADAIFMVLDFRRAAHKHNSSPPPVAGCIRDGC